MKGNFIGLIVHLCDIDNNDLIKNNIMYPLISDICLLSAARYFKVIAMKDDLLNLFCANSDMCPPELLPLLLHKTMTCCFFIDSRRPDSNRTDEESQDCTSVSLAGRCELHKKKKKGEAM